MKKVSIIVFFLLISVGAMASTLQITVTNKSLFGDVVVTNPLLDSGLIVKIEHPTLKSGESDIVNVSFNEADIGKKFNLEFINDYKDVTVKYQIKKDYFGKIGVACIDAGGTTGDISGKVIYNNKIKISI